MKLFLMCLVFLLSAAVAYGDILSLKDEEITGKVIESFKHDGQSYAQIATDKEIVWVKMPQTKLVKGKTYAFYPAYLESADYVVSPKREKLKKLLYTIGIVDQKIDHEKYSFRGIKIGTPMGEVSARLKEMGYKITESDYGDENQNLITIEVHDFLLGTVALELSFQGDTCQKLAGYSFRQSRNASAVDEEWANSTLSLMNQVFEAKYGKARRCQELESLYLEGTQQRSCSWDKGDYSIFTNYIYENGTGYVSGKVTSFSRSLLSLNKFSQLVDDLEKLKQENIENYERKIVKEGAESY